MRSQTFAEKESRRAKRRAKLGPTGDFPHGKLNAQDEGGLTMAIGLADDGKTVTIDFGKKIAWFGLPKEQAIAFAMTILKHATGAKSFVIGNVEPVDAGDLGKSGQSDSEVEPRRQ